jgi:thiol:disulfide interchange protein DsbA
MFKKLAAVALLSLAPVLTFAASFVEGKDYKVLASGQVETRRQKIEVREFFWYGCPHCFRLDPFIEMWLKTKPARCCFCAYTLRR